jgi:hypothetical protein
MDEPTTFIQVSADGAKKYYLHHQPLKLILDSLKKDDEGCVMILRGIQLDKEVSIAIIEEMIIAEKTNRALKEKVETRDKTIKDLEQALKYDWHHQRYCQWDGER